MIIRAYWQQRGGHVHVRVFTGQREHMTFAKAGDLTFDVREWPAVSVALSQIATLRPEAATIGSAP